MKISREKDPRAILRRLDLALDEALPDETPEETVRRLGVDVDVLAARIRNRLDAAEATGRGSRTTDPPPVEVAARTMGALVELERRGSRPDRDSEPDRGSNPGHKTPS